MSILQQLKPYVSIKTYKAFSKLIISGGSRSHYLLDFSNGQYAAFWRPFVIPKSVEEIVNRLEAGKLINNEDTTRPFIEGLSYVTNVKSDAIEYIKSKS
ncbi:hypothetical protein [Acinetobacter terrestris]|uniref:hypothetical protein n=1 Tax=Acinetobacter terrestris TaxID=2529843 RepID=UPI0010407596|nr:hypothetical protein [Acinetobacter terrestris]TCB41094.1 hypothetical protein E0H83_13960 [Acinetobacter terrestris]TCB58264.1 hypothetical protein E0H81_15660 [Acinetobacter terrestris]